MTAPEQVRIRRPRGVLLVGWAVALLFACSSTNRRVDRDGDGDGTGGSTSDTGSAQSGTPTSSSSSAGGADNASATSGAATGQGGAASGNGGSPGGNDDDGASGESGASGETGAGGQGPEGDCAVSQACVQRAAPGWSGPAATAAGSSVPACPAAYPVVAFDAGTSLSAAPAVCDCQCGTQSGTCGTTVGVDVFFDETCEGTPDEVVNNWATSTCQDASSAKLRLPVPNTSCTPTGTVAETVPMARFDNVVRGCEGATLGASCEGDGVCMPAPPGAFDELCVYRSGEHECPTGYPVGSLVHEGFSDDRGCPGTCSCSASGGDCSLTVTTYNGPGGGALCGNTVGYETATTTGDQCVSSGNRIVRFGNPTFVEGSGSCQGADPAPAGSAVAQDPITICCRD